MICILQAPLFSLACTTIITADAAREMQLRNGQTAAALMKSTEVMIVRV